MTKKKAILLSITILFIGLIITAGSYAFWSWSSNTNKIIVFNTAMDLQNYIVYDEGESKFVGDFQVSDSYIDGIHTTISINKTSAAANADLLATIYMDINSIGTNMKNSDAVKWVVTEGDSSNPGTVLASDTFTGIDSGDTIVLVPNLIVTTTLTKYTIWIWIDSSESFDPNIVGETLDTDIWTEINQADGNMEIFDVSRVTNKSQRVEATVISNNSNITHYAITTTNTEPELWFEIDLEDQKKMYNFSYLVPAANTYYLWFKNADSKIVSRSVTVVSIDDTAPTCSFGAFNPGAVKTNVESTIELTCTDSESRIESVLSTSDFTLSNSNSVTINSVTRVGIQNGVKYVIVVKGKTNSTNTTISLASDKVLNSANLGNSSVTSGIIYVNNETTKPTLNLSVTGGGTYAKENVATVTISDNVMLRPGSYTIKYAWSTTALTCNDLTETAVINVLSGEASKTASITINSQTGAGKIYICNADPIYDEVGNYLASNTAKNANMYLDNTGPTGTMQLTVNGGVRATLSLSDVSNVSSTYYYKIDNQPLTCDSTTTGFIAGDSASYTFSVASVGTYYVCAKAIDTLGNVSYFSDSILVKAYLKTLSGDNDAFKDSSYKTNITNIRFVNNVNIPNDAVATYDLDETNAALIKGWLVDDPDVADKYILYIGATSTIYGRNLYRLFKDMTGVKNISFDNFDTSEATNMYDMFYGMTGLNYLDVSNFDTSNVNTMREMFFGCTNLVLLDLSNFDTSSLTNTQSMFHNCTNLLSIIVDSNIWDMSGVTTTTNMFYNCSSLIGQNGTSYSSSYTNKNMAVIDTDETPGYLTEVPSSNVLEYSNHLGNTTRYLSTGILKNQIKKITFINSISGHSANGVDTWDVSYQKNGSVLAWVGSPDANNQYEMTIGQTGGVVPLSGDNLFKALINLVTIDGMQYFITTDLRVMRSMFYDCNSLTSLDLSNFNTSKVTLMNSTFKGCSNLTSLDLSNFNTSKVKTMSNLFAGCHKIRSLDLSNFDTSKVTTMANMFDMNYNGTDTALEYLNLSSFDTSHVTNMSSMFSRCSKLPSLDLSSFDTSSVTDTRNMFSYCTVMYTIYVSNSWDVSNVTATNSANMFSNCSALIGGNGYRFNTSYINKTKAIIDTANNTGYLTNAPASNALIYSTTGASTAKFLLTDIPKGQIKKITFTNSISGHTPNGIDTWDVSLKGNGVVLAWVGSPDGNGMYEMTIGQAGGVVATNGSSLFRNLNNLVTIDGMQYLDVSNSTDMRAMFDGCSSLTSLDVSHFSTSNVMTMRTMFRNCSSISNLNFSSFNTSKVTDMAAMFDGCSSLSSINLNNFNTSNVTDMGWMFQNCAGLSSLDVSHFTTSNVTKMNDIFSGCSGLTSITFGTFNTSSVTTMENMFKGCSSLTSLNLSGFNTSNVTTMKSMFENCSSLTSLNVTSFNTSNVTTMENMFSSCSSLTKYDLSSFDTSNVSSMATMFKYGRMSELDLSNFNTSSLTNAGYMFYDCYNLSYLNLSSFNTSNLKTISYMFRQCNNLIAVYVSPTTWTTSAVTAGVTPFYNGTNKITGGNGTMYTTANDTYQYANIDASGSPGYLTAAPTSNVLMPGSIKAATTKFLSTNIVKNKIKKITFTNSISGHAPNGTDTWDVSFQKNGSVLAWVGTPDGNGMYEMTIGQNGGVVALNGYGLFAYLTGLTTIDGMEYLDVSNLTLMRRMFQNCSSLTTLDLSTWDTSNVLLMNDMFNGCSSLTTIYASTNWSTSNVINSANMFNGATQLPNFNSSVIDVTNAHYGTGGYLTYKAI